MQIESLLRAKVPPTEIARLVGCHHSTVYREIRRGRYSHLNTDYTTTFRYSATKGDAWASFNRTTQGAQPKIGNDRKFAAFCAEMLKDGYSPAAILMYIKEHNLSFRTRVCRATLYNYVYKGMFLGVTEKHLLRQGRLRKATKRKQERKAPLRGRSIEERPQEVLYRSVFGHWEMDSVIGKAETKETLLVFTERKTRMQLVFRSNKTAAATVTVLDLLEKKLGKSFSKIFRTITCDNGSEFAYTDELERNNRTAVYYCHPFCSSERGSNENQNAFLRRFIRKGSPIEQYTDDQIKQAADFINDYPRAIFDGKSARQLFESELSILAPEILQKNLDFFRKTT